LLTLPNRRFPIRFCQTL